MSIIWGINVGTHDSSITSVVDNEIVFAAHGERSSRIKNDKVLPETTVRQALRASGNNPDKIVYYERDLLKRARQIYAGQYRTALIKPRVSSLVPLVSYPHWISSTSVAHHHSHAAAGYYTSPYRDAAVLVVDSIGAVSYTHLTLPTSDLV